MKRKDRDMIKGMKSSISEKDAERIKAAKRTKDKERKKAARKRNLIVVAGVIVVAIIAISVVILVNRAPSSDTIPEPDQTETAANTAVLETSKGTIQIQLMPEAAPATVANFKEIAEAGHYINSFFHRIIKDTSMECAINPDSQNRPGFDDVMPIELSSAGAGTYTLSTVLQPGADGMMKQCFFKINKGMPDDNGTVFGKVVSGQEIVDEMLAIPTIKHVEDNNYDVDPAEVTYPENPDDVRIFNISFQ